jgi:hypothetical protein
MTYRYFYNTQGIIIKKVEYKQKCIYTSSDDYIDSNEDYNINNYTVDISQGAIIPIINQG